jgi:chemotaxis protein MotB
MRPYKRHKHNPERGVDDWLMTYADMITLLLCFFAIFLSVSIPKQDAFQQARAKVLEKFATAEKFPLDKKLPVGDQRVDLPYDKLPSIVDQYLAGEVSGTGQVVYLTPTRRQNDKGDQKNKGPADKAGGEQKPLPEGDRIKTFEIPSAAFFTSGSADLSAEGQKLLQAMIDDHLKKDDMKDYQITVEGHTDDAPIHTAQFPSNWELSTARAASVVRYFVGHGVEASRLRAAGYADIQPKVPNRDPSGAAIPSNQAQNRRVVIKLEKVERAQNPAP